MSPNHHGSRRTVHSQERALPNPSVWRSAERPSDTALYKVSLTCLLEVVETEEIKDMGRLNTILDYYRERGIASMEYLRALRPDYVKIDRDIVREAEHDSRIRHSFKAMVRLVLELNCKIIAEGIETSAQAELCREIGGYCPTLVALVFDAINCFAE